MSIWMKGMFFASEPQQTEPHRHPHHSEACPFQLPITTNSVVTQCPCPPRGLDALLLTAKFQGLLTIGEQEINTLRPWQIANKEGIITYEGHVKGFGSQLEETPNDRTLDSLTINKHNDFQALKYMRYISVCKFIVVFKKTFICYPCRISQLIMLETSKYRKEARICPFFPVWTGAHIAK